MKKENGLIDTIELKHMFEEAKKIKRGGEYKLLQDAFLISAHSFVGGARSKAIGAINLDTKEVFWEIELNLSKIDLCMLL